MVDFRHLIRMIEGEEDVATLRYEGSLPSAPTIGLVVKLSFLVEFQISDVSYLPSEQIYETSSLIDLTKCSGDIDYPSPRVNEAARLVKYGFVVMDCDDETVAEINNWALHCKA